MDVSEQSQVMFSFTYCKINYNVIVVANEGTI